MKLVALGVALVAVAGVHAASTSSQHKPKKSFFKNLKKKINSHLKDNFSKDEIKHLKRKFNQWKKKNHKHYKDNNDDATKFEFFMDNEIKIKKALKRHFNLTLDGPFADLTLKEFQEKVLMPNIDVHVEKNEQGKKRSRFRRAIKDEYQQTAGWPIEIPDWIKECSQDLSCGLSDIEFSWDCAEPREFTAAEIAEAKSQTTVDLRTSQNKFNRPLVTPIKDQGMCGSCWSFSATGAMESLMLREETAPAPGGSNAAHPDTWWGLSEQQLIDCTWDRRKMGPFVNHDCGGGWPSNAFVYTTVVGGWMEEETYPYDSGYLYSRNYGCYYDDEFNVMTEQITGQCRQVEPESEEALMAAVYHHGAVNVVVDSAGTDWQLYRGGIANPRSCSSSSLNHAVLLVGYGEENGEKYWIIRNSWGEWWGEDGYMRIKRDASNVCGVATMPHYPTFEAYPAI